MGAGGSCRIVALISGGGTNLQAIIDATAAGEIPGEMAAVLSNKAGVRGLERAAEADIPTEVIEHRNFSDRASFDAAMREAIDQYQPDLVVLAGFMRILTPEFVQHYQGRMLNIHPSLLPAYPGLHTHQRAIEAGDSQHGATVHFVTAELDGGPSIVQGRVPIEHNDTPESLAARVLTQEHRIYPIAARWFCEGRLELTGEGVLFDGNTLHAPLDIEQLPH